MKQLAIVSLLFLLSLAGAQGQINIPESIDKEDIRPQDIPSEATLRFMGVPEDQIEKAMEFKEGRKTLQELESEFFQLNLGTPDTTGLQGQEEEEALPETATDIADQLEIPTAPPSESGIYGHDYFRNADISIFERFDFAKAPSNYVLGPEDVVSISVWGYSEFDGEFTINNDGYIKPDGMGRIYLKGMAFSEAKSLIRRKLAGYMDLRYSKLAISLTYSRSIKVNIVGEVINPGSYQIAAINTAFNALMAAGGPNDFGSVRQIYVKRDGKTVRTLDIYEFLLNPNSREDYFLQHNDYIFVPRLGKVSHVAGEVKKPTSYELLDHESLADLIDYAGGFKPAAVTNLIQVSRYYGGDQRIIDVAFDSLQLDNSEFSVFDGDSVFVYKIPSVIDNFVEITGQVKLPGRFEFVQGMRVSDLLGKSEGLTNTAFTQRAYLIRINPDLSREYIPLKLEEIITKPRTGADRQLQNYDRLRIFSKEDFSESTSVSISGAVRNEGTFVYGKDMTLKDLLYFAGGIKPEAANNRIEISRIINFDESVNKDEPSRTVVDIIEIGANLTIDFESEGIQLRPFDHVFVRETPNFEMQQNVTIKGEVGYPGVYSLENRNDRLTTLIERAGGFSAEAFVAGIKLYRNGGNAGVVFVDFDKAQRKPESRYNYILEDGDEITIPKLNQLVSMEGAILYPGIDSIGQVNAPYIRGKRAGHYVRSYGAGYTRAAQRRRTYVELPNGVVRRTKNFGFFRIPPRVEEGSTIVVREKSKKPRKEKREKKERDPATTTAIVTTITTSLTTVLTLFFILTSR